MAALKRYLAEEVAEDHRDGAISRRDALRRLAVLGLTATSASAVLAACARDDDPEAVATDGPTDRTPAGPTPSPTEDIEFDGPAGMLFGAYASSADPKGAVLVIHENRGLTDHIRSVAGRLATSGYAALSLDLLSRQGGTADVGTDEAIMAALSRASDANLIADMKAGLDELERRQPDANLGAMGFCFGGGMVWALLDAGEDRLRAAAPFYGTIPEDGADFSGSSNAAVLGIYAELDNRVNGTRDGARQALEDADLTHEIVTFPGVDHAFFNATGERYNREQAEAAYTQLIAWFDEHLA